MTVVVVVPTEKHAAESPGLVDSSEAVRELRPVLHRLELALRVRIVVRHMRPAVRLVDAEVGQEEGHRLGTHRAAAVGMKGQLSALDALLYTGLFDERNGQGFALAIGHQPTDDIAAEDVQDDVELKEHPFG